MPAAGGTDRPAAQYTLALHAEPAVESPVTGQNRPTGHCVATDSPVTGQKLPALHGVVTVMPMFGQNLPVVHGVPIDNAAAAQ